MFKTIMIIPDNTTKISHGLEMHNLSSSDGLQLILPRDLNGIAVMLVYKTKEAKSEICCWCKPNMASLANQE